MSGPNWKLEDDLKTVTVTFPTDPPVQMKLDAAGVEEVLKNLGTFRGMMKPDVASTFPLGQKVEAIPDPAWATEPDFLLGNSLLHVRDPRYGWLHYLIPREEVRKLSQLLQNQATAQPLGPPQGKPN